MPVSGLKETALKPDLKPGGSQKINRRLQVPKNIYGRLRDFCKIIGSRFALYNEKPYLCRPKFSI
jgi:hypothetical protein